VKELPLNGRSFDSLILLNAGTIKLFGMRNPGGGGTAQKHFAWLGGGVGELYHVQRRGTGSGEPGY